MKTTQEIYLDYKQAMAQADRLDELSDQMHRLQEQKYAEIINGLRSAWTGDNARKFLTKASRLQEEMEQAETNLRNIAENIRIRARSIRQADMEAAQLAQRQ